MARAKRGTSPAYERDARDYILAELERIRHRAVAYARCLARQFAITHGAVTSTDVWTMLSNWPQLWAGLELDRVDPRWMGAVFNEPCWTRKSWARRGSHARPVTVWMYDQTKD